MFACSSLDPSLVPHDAYPDLPVHLGWEAYAGEHAVSDDGTHGQYMCLAKIEAKGDDQDEKPLQAYTRSIYWSVIRSSITSRDRTVFAFAPPGVCPFAETAYPMDPFLLPFDSRQCQQ
jgi:hypothetical protein